MLGRHLADGELFGRHVGEGAVDVGPGPLVHRLDERGGPVGRVEGDEDEPAVADPFHDSPPRLRLHLGLTNMPPPDEDVGVVEERVSDPLLGVVELHRTDREPRLLLQMGGDCVAEKVVVGLLLRRLLLVPDEDAARPGRRRRREIERRKPGEDAALPGVPVWPLVAIQAVAAGGELEEPADHPFALARLVE